MADESFKRKLTAILSADVEGYSRLMGEDEDATIRTLTTYRELMSTIIQKHRGRVVDSPGDNLLAEFGSVVGAVRSAVEIQEELSVRNTELPDNRRMEFRIGVNLGDVVEEGERIYGDGVNITARVEELAEGGGICISGTVYDSIKNKLSVGYESLGEHKVKNIKEPVRVYRMRVGPDVAALGVRKGKKLVMKRWHWAALTAMVALVVGAVAMWNFYFRLPSIEPASMEKMAYPLPDKPSIVVLPFDNLSGDPEYDYLADGISDNIITALSYIPQMFVIARNSSMIYKEKPVKVQQVSEELGVRYVLEGSVLKSEDKVRITAQLIDALTGGHLWSERYDRDLKDLFDLFDEITQSVTVALQVKLTHGEQARMWYKSTHSLEAWGYTVKGLGPFYYFTKEAMVKSRELFERAIEIDPEYAHALTMLAWTHWVDARYSYTDSRDESFETAIKLAKVAVALDDSDPLVHSLWQHIYLIQNQHDKAIEEGRKAIALGPNNAESHILFGAVLYRSGIFEESVEMCEKAIRLHPHTPSYYLGHMEAAYYWAGRYEEALEWSKKLIERSRKVKYWNGVAWGCIGSASALMRLGRESEASQYIAEALKIQPWWNLDWERSNGYYKDSEQPQQFYDDMRKLGVPEHPPSK
jgi:adenylate cyclase